MALKRIDDKSGEDLKIPFYRVEIHVHKVTSESLDNTPQFTNISKNIVDLGELNANTVLAAAGLDLIETK